MQVTVTALYAGLLAVFALYLSFGAGSFRGRSGIPMLYGEPVNWELATRVRRHQNFLEYVPLLLILMALIELNGGSTIFLHVTGIALIAARVAHMVGLNHENMTHPARAAGAGVTALLTLAAAAYAVWLALAARGA